MIDGYTSRTHFYVSMQQPGLVCAINPLPSDALEVQGQRVRSQPDSFWSYYPGDVGFLCKRAASWNPQQSRITKENKEYMTALAKGVARDETKQTANDHGEIFSARWHHHLTNSVYRPSTAKPNISRGSRPPTSGTERIKLTVSTLTDMNRPTTAPVSHDGAANRSQLGKSKSAAPHRPSAPLRAPRTLDSASNFDNLTSSSFLHLTDGLKPSILKADNNFVHQICSNTNDNQTDVLSTSRDSFLDTSNVNNVSETSNEKSAIVNETIIDDLDDSKNENEITTTTITTAAEVLTVTATRAQTTVGSGMWQRDAKSGRLEAYATAPGRKIPHTEFPIYDIERRMVERESEAIRQRQAETDEFCFERNPFEEVEPYEFKSPFSDEFYGAISAQTQSASNNGNGEWNLKDFYRDVKTPFESRSNEKPVFERCLKLARLQVATSKWEQRRRQILTNYNRLVKNLTTDNNSVSNLNGSFSSKSNVTSEKENRELNELRRELRCNECKRINCLGNCAPGQDYHLYKRLVSSISSQLSASRQPTFINGAHRCKHGCTTCSTNHSRTTADIINANAIINSLNNTNNATNNVTAVNRLRSSKTTFSFGQKNQRAPIDLRPRSMHQVTREMKFRFEQANLSPVVVVPLFEDESQSILNKRAQFRHNNGLLPGKSFRSQRRDSLTLITAPKILS